MGKTEGIGGDDYSINRSPFIPNQGRPDPKNLAEKTALESYKHFWKKRRQESCERLQ